MCRAGASAGAALARSRTPSTGARALFRVPLRRSEILAELLRGAARTVSWRVPLDAPPLLQWARIHDVEAELIEQLGDSGLGLVIVPGDHERAAVLRAGRL